MTSHISPHCSANYGEALATRLAISLATSLKLENFKLEGDSQVVILSL
jgi:ribonuclease HI